MYCYYFSLLIQNFNYDSKTSHVLKILFFVCLMKSVKIEINDNFFFLRAVSRFSRVGFGSLHLIGTDGKLLSKNVPKTLADIPHYYYKRMFLILFFKKIFM